MARTYRFCGMLEQTRDKDLCAAVRVTDRVTKKVTRVRCGYLNDDGVCNFITKEDRIAAENKAAKRAEKLEQEGGEIE